jgi:NADH-quinone oxidoreductase subunit C
VGTALSPDELGSRLRARFGRDILDLVEQHGHTVATVTTERYRDVCRFLRDDPAVACEYCDFTTGVDFGPEGGFEVVTHLFSIRHRHNVRIKVKLPYDEPVCPTVSDLFPTSNWHERETREMFGIRFDGHPKPVKLLLSEPFEGQPLRKDFPLMSREAKPWPGAVEGEDLEDEE